MEPEDSDLAAGDFERIAGALVTAVRRSVRESMDRRLCHSEALGQQHSRTHSEQQSPTTAEESCSTAYERAIMLQSTMRRDGSCLSRSATTRRLLPSAFRAAKRGRKGVSPREQSANGSGSPKATLYQRDIMCLPCNSRGRDDGVIQIPRGKCRARLAEAGLLGKVELTSVMDAEEVKSEICQVFMVPMALSKNDIANKRFFEFSYLQKTGMGSRSLCLPAVSSGFEWNGRQVAGLARSGGYIYILAAGSLPGCNLAEFSESSLQVRIRACAVYC